jgi:hypothetical protein
LTGDLAEASDLSSTDGPDELEFLRIVTLVAGDIGGSCLGEAGGDIVDFGDVGDMGDVGDRGDAGS